MTALSVNPAAEARWPPRTPRTAVEAEIVLRRPGQHAYRVRLHDVSPEGCKAELVERTDVDELVWVRFDGIEMVPARVRWTAGFLAGLRFVRPLHPAVFDRLVERMRGAWPSSGGCRSG